MMIQKKFWFFRLSALFFAAALFLSGCANDGRRVILTTGFGRDDIFRIGDEICKRNEIMLYLTTIQNQYEEVYGSEIWNVSLDGITLEQNIKDTVLARIAQVKTMYLLAKQREIELSPEEKEQIQRAEKSFFASLNDTEKEKLGVRELDIEKMYTEYALARKVYQEIIADVNPEISDDDARIITVQMMFFSTTMKDGAGKRVDYTGREKEAVYQTAVSVKELADKGDKNFEDLAAQYSDASEITFSFGKEEVEKAVEDAAFNLSKEEISDVVEGENGYYLIKCINTFDREETDANKLKIMEKRKDEAFGAEYDVFVQGLVRKLNEEQWEKIALIRDENVKTSDFFQVYDRYFH